MTTLGWTILIIALLGIIAATIIIIVLVRRAPPEERLEKAILDAADARRRAELQEDAYRELIAETRDQLNAIRQIKDERQRLTALAALANSLKKRGG